MRSRVLATALAAMMLVSVIAVSSPNACAIPALPIAITSDSDLIVYPGSGTPSDPYVIADMYIDAGGSGAAISIEGTTAYVLVESCTLLNADHGVYVNTGNVTVEDNTISSVATSGVYIDAGWSNDAIVGNTISDSLIDGIDVYSSGTYIANNTVGSSGSDGVYLESVSDCTIFNNTISGSGDQGILIVYSSSCLILSNLINDDTDQQGVLLYYSSDSRVLHNSVNGGSQGVYLTHSSNVVVWDNRLNVDYMGAYVDHSDGCAFSSNAISGGGDHGIYFWYSDGNALSSNIITDFQYLINLMYSNDNSVHNNTLTSGWYGVDLFHCVGNVVDNNTVTGPDEDGILLVSSNGNDIADNTVTDPGTSGIELDDCWAHLDRNTLVNGSIAFVFNSVGDPEEYAEGIEIANTNTVNGLPVYFAKNANMDHAVVPSGVGEVILINVTHLNVASLRPDGGVKIAFCSNISVHDNRVANASSNIQIYSSPDCLVDGNELIGAPWGIEVGESARVVVSRNSVEGSGFYGIVLMFSTACSVSANTVADSEVGIRLSFADDSIIANNTITGSGAEGIYATFSTGNTMLGNRVLHSAGRGVYCTGDNRIYGNMFVGNNGATSTYDTSHLQAFGIGSVWNSTDFGNFWSDWTSLDSDHDGIVDLPYNLAGADHDYLPLASVIEVEITSPSISPFITNVATVTVTGTTSGGLGSNVTRWHNELTGESGTTGGASWSVNVPLAQGANEITITSTDSTGLLPSVKTILIGYSPGPIVTMSPSSGSTTYANHSGAQVTFGITDVEPMTTANMSHYVDGTLVGRQALGFVSGQTSYSGSMALGLTVGTNVFYFTFNDSAANSVTVHLTVIMDTTPPQVTIESPTGNNVSTTATISATFSEKMNASSVSLVIDGLAGTASWSGNTTIFTPSAPLQYNTTYSVTVTGKDLAGNHVTATWSFRTLKNEGNVSGTIEDSNGNPIVGATVWLSIGRTTTTDSQGHFQFSNVPSGTSTLTVTKGGYDQLNQDVSVTAGHTTNLGTVSIQTTTAASTDYTLVLVVIVVVLIVAVLAALILVRRRKGPAKP